MRADRVEVFWDSKKDKWMVRIHAGEDVIRRYCGAPKGADEEALRSVAQQTVKDEGYEPDLAQIAIRR